MHGVDKLHYYFHFEGTVVTTCTTSLNIKKFFHFFPRSKYDSHKKHQLHP
jgi:hypothetical protein